MQVNVEANPPKTKDISRKLVELALEESEFFV